MMTKKLPTILALGFLLLAMGALVFLWQTIRSISSKATGGLIPKDIRVTNITSTGFSVSYLTSDLAKGSIVVDGVGVFPDIRDNGVTAAKTYNIHYFNVTGLEAKKSYAVKLENNPDPIAVLTIDTAAFANNQPEPLFGKVTKANGLPIGGGIIYINSANTISLSSLIKADGSFLLTFNNTGFPVANDPMVTIFIQAGNDGTTTGSCSLSGLRTVGSIVLGKSITCTQTKISVETNNIQYPVEGEKLNSATPTFRGTATPGKIINVEVHSDTVLSGTTKTDASGNWAWTSAETLSAGLHTLTVTFIDESGQKQTILRNFTVLAAGNSQNILPVAIGTPSASIIPTPIPTQIPVTPKTAEPETLMIALTAGIFLATLGMLLVKKSYVRA